MNDGASFCRHCQRLQLLFSYGIVKAKKGGVTMGWSIFAAVLGGVALVVFVLLLLPVQVVFKSNKGEPELYGRFLGIAMGKRSEDGKQSKVLGRLFGVPKKESSQEEKAEKRDIGKQLTMWKSILKRTVTLLKRCRITRLRLHILCAGEDAAATAITYGTVSAAVYTLLGFLESATKLRPRARDVSVSCDYDRPEGEFLLEATLSVALYRVVKALLDVVWDTVKKENHR
ncbi:MAG: DUF2953 domain-containing protein [Ruminococcaceae bacterium]|nr:DUF2953 domain-containing protein [Oscillospiraceae bacterium]